MQTILITGANRGLGLEHARQYLRRGERVIALARAPDEATDLAELVKQNPGQLEIYGYDALDADAPARIKRQLADRPIDLILANAGANGARREAFGSVDAAAMLQLIEINAVAPLKLAEALIENLAASERKLLAFQSSLMGSIGDNASGSHYAYRVAKAALNMVAKTIAVDLRSRAVISVALHPGWVRTRMGGEQAPLALADSVAGQQSVLDRLTLADSGGFFNFDGRVLPW